MKPLLTVLGLSCAFMILGVVTFGAVVGVRSGQTSWLLVAVFVFDSVLLAVLAGYVLLRKWDNAAGPRP